MGKGKILPVAVENMRKYCERVGYEEVRGNRAGVNIIIPKMAASD